jgi:outer membrane protein
MKNILILTALTIPFSSPCRAQELEVTAKNINRLLEEGNARVSAAALSLEAAESRGGFFARSFLPSLEFFGARETFKKGTHPVKTQPTYGAEARINLFNGGRDFLENETRGLEADKRAAGLKRAKSEETQKARAAYWQILFLRAKEDLLRGALTVNQENLGAAQKRIRSGVATDSDRFEFEMKEVDLRREREQAKLALIAETNSLSVLLNAKDGAKRAFPESLGHDHDYEGLLKHTEESHSFLYAEAEALARQGDVLAKIQERAWWPKLDAYAAFYQFNEREEELADAKSRRESALGLRLSLSFGGGLEGLRESGALAKEAEAQRALAELERREVEAHFHQELNELKFLHGQVHDAEENIRKAERYYKLTQSEYGRGVKNSPDVLGASEKLLGMRLKMLEIVRDFQIAKSHVLAKMGR